MPNTTAVRCKKCLVPYKPQENTFEKVQACECADPDMPVTLKMSPGLFDFIFRAAKKEPR